MQTQPLDNNMLKQILDKYAPGVDVAGDGIYQMQWVSTETFYRHTEDYVVPEKRTEYKRMLEMTFPGKKGVF